MLSESADNREALANYRFDMAQERLRSAKTLLDTGCLKDSIGRFYYAMFTAARAVLALDGVDFSKHAGVIGYFQKNYIKNGLIETKYSKYLSQAFQIRNNTDYADFFIVTKAEALEQYDRAVEFVTRLKKYVREP